jgi:hypothetical protein
MVQISRKRRSLTKLSGKKSVDSRMPMEILVSPTATVNSK